MDIRFKRVKGIVYAGVKPFRGRTKWVSMKTHDMTVARQKAKDAKLYKMQAVENANALSTVVFTRIKGIDATQVNLAIDDFVEKQALKGRSVNTVALLRSMLMQWMRETGTSKLLTCDIGAVHFRKFFNPGDDTKLKTLEMRQYACVAFCDYCVDLGIMWSNHARSVGIDKTNLTQEQKLTKSHKPITNEEFAKVMAAVKDDPFWYLACLTAWEYGLRISDVCLLERISVVDEHLRLITRKSNTFVKLPLTNDIVSIINKLDRSEHEHEFQFIFPKERAEYLLYGADTFSDRFSRICKRAGVVGKTFHGLRTAFINRTYKDKSESILLRMSQELAKRETAAAAGHRNTSTTDIYLRAGEEHNGNS